MAEDLSAPLGRRRAAAKPASRGVKLKPTALPLARIAFGVAAFIVVGIGARLLLVNDPMGGRPSRTCAPNGPRRTAACIPAAYSDPAAAGEDRPAIKARQVCKPAYVARPLGRLHRAVEVP